VKETFKDIRSFDWDDGNRDKNRVKHDVLTGEAEQIFFNEPIIILNDLKHSQTEQRFAAFGVTNKVRTLVVVYTIRNNRIRVISARDMNKKERVFYENQD